MKSLLKLNFKAWILSPGPYFVFFFSLMMMVLMGQFIPLATLMPIMIVTNTMSIALWSFGQNFMELKNSVIIKRIGVTPLSKGAFLWTTLLFSFLIICVGALWIIALTFGFQFLAGHGIGIVPEFVGLDGAVENNVDLLKNVNWVGFSFGFLINAIVSLVIAFFFISISKGNEMYGLYTNLYYFLASFGGGLFIPSQVIIANSDVLSFLSWLTPTAYINEYMIGTIHGFSLLNFEYEVNPFMWDPTLTTGTAPQLDEATVNPDWVNMPAGTKVAPSMFDFQNPIDDPVDGMWISQTSLIHRDLNGVIDLTLYSNNFFYYMHSIALDIIIPVLFIVILSAISLKTFKWAK